MYPPEYHAAIIGCGRKGSTIDSEDRWLINYDLLPCSHAAAYRVHPQTLLTAGASGSEKSAEDVRERWGVERVYMDYLEMLEKEKPDIVSVTTHAHLHAEVTVAAASSGVKAILVEKAMATSIAEAEAMIATCREKNVKLLVNHPRRFHGTFHQMKRHLQEGHIGELQMVVVMGYGKLMHNGSHVFDFLRDFCGEVDWVTGELIETDDPDDPDGRAMVKMKSGVTAFVDFASGQPFEFILFGSEGRMVVDQFTDGVTLVNYEPENPEETGPWFRYRPKREVRRHYFNKQPMKPPMLGAVTELVATIASDRDPVSTGEDGLRCIEVGIAIHLSARNGSLPVTLPLTDKKYQVISR